MMDDAYGPWNAPKEEVLPNGTKSKLSPDYREPPRTDAEWREALTERAMLPGIARAAFLPPLLLLTLGALLGWALRGFKPTP